MPSFRTCTVHWLHCSLAMPLLAKRRDRARLDRMGLFDPSWEKLLIVLVIALIVLGPKKLPEVGRSLGKGIREFKDSVSGHDHPDEAPPQQPAASIEPPAQSTYTAPTTEQGPVHHTD